MAADTVRAILFDLDDTLLGNDMDRFLKAYFGLLAPHVAAYVPPEKFMPALLAATRAMVENTDPGATNQQVFAADFFPRVGWTMDELMPVFDDFYAMQFGKLRSHTRCLPEARARWDAQLWGYQRMPAEELLSVQAVRLHTPLARILSRAGHPAICDICGEEIMNEREVIREGMTLCKSCAGQSYYTFTANMPFTLPLSAPVENSFLAKAGATEADCQPTSRICV